METIRKTFDDRPGKWAIVDADTHRIIRWEPKSERENPVGDVGTFRARNPAELVTHDRASNPHNNAPTTMERENAVTEYASEVLSLLESGGTIFLGDLTADYAFGFIDQQLEGQNPMIRKGVNWVGPAVAGVAVYNLSTNKYVRGLAVGHAFNSARKLATWGLGMVFGDGNGDSSDSSESSDSGTSKRLAGRTSRPALAGRGMAGTYASQAQGPVSVGGVEERRGTVMPGA